MSGRVMVPALVQQKGHQRHSRLLVEGAGRPLCRAKRAFGWNPTYWAERLYLRTSFWNGAANRSKLKRGKVSIGREGAAPLHLHGLLRHARLSQYY